MAGQPGEPSKVIVWGNGMVMVFDAAGQQVPTYRGQQMQGPIEVVREALSAIVPMEHWQRGEWAVARPAFVGEG